MIKIGQAAYNMLIDHSSYCILADTYEMTFSSVNRRYVTEIARNPILLM